MVRDYQTKCPMLSLVILLSAGVDIRAGYIPFDWGLGTYVSDLNGSSNGQAFTTVTSPFQQTSFSSLGPHTAQANYDFVFQPELNLGTFHTEIALHVGVANGINSGHTGRFRITPDTDLPIHINASLNYATPSTPVVDVGFTIRMLDVDNPLPILFIGGGVGGTLSLNPAIGTLSALADRILLAGHTYQIFWDAKIRTVTQPLPGGLSNASGFVNFSIVPEPASLSMLGLFAGGCLLRSRRRERP